MQNRVTGRPSNDLIGTAEISLALEESSRALTAADPGSQAWRWRVRRSLGGVRDVLESEPVHSGGWMAAKAASNRREGARLLARLQALAPRVLVDEDAAAVTADLQQLLAEVQRHVQRLNDLVYDEVELELGGSE